MEMTQIYVALYCITGIFELVAGVLMLCKRRQHRDRSRLLISVFFLLTSVVIACTVALMLSGRYVKGEHILGTGAILIGFAIFFLLLLYPLEVLRPNWLNARRLLALLLPWLMFAVILVALAPFGYTQLHYPSEILENITRSDVLLRVILALIFIPYGLWLLFIRYNWRNSSAPKKWIHAIVLIAMAMTVTFSMNRLLGIRWMMYLHMLLYDILTAVILIMEFKVRFRVPRMEDACLAAAVPDETEVVETPIAEEVSKSTIELVQERLRIAMDNPEIWQNPDLTRGKLCNIIGTNTNYLQKAIKELGYTSYYEMINNKRIEFVRKELESGTGENIQDIFYRAGYRSRVTAWRNFTNITGTNPSALGNSQEVSEF